MSYFANYLGDEGYGTYRVDWSGERPFFERVSRPAEVLLIPGFVDLHIHGAFGIDFMSASRSDMLLLCEKLEKVGYERFYPTTVTTSAQGVRAAFANLPEHEMIGGVHLEGPFISPKFPGAQPVEWISSVPVSKGEWDDVLEDPRLKIITVAPEMPNSLEFITKLSSRGVIVNMGHSDATFDEARFGFEFGASRVTHTFNAMRGFHHREAGIAGYALINDSIECELIYDRLHVSKEAVRLLCKAKPNDKLFCVSDSTEATGMAQGHKFMMWGHECVTGKNEVRLVSNGALAGSAVTLLDSFRMLCEDFGEEIAIRLCSINPRKAMGMSVFPKVFVELDRKREVVGLRRVS